MAQQRDGVIFHESAAGHLKLVGKLYDQVNIDNMLVIFFWTGPIFSSLEVIVDYWSIYHIHH